MTTMTGYQCFVCAVAQPADFDGFLCPACGGNLDVIYDYDAIAEDARRCLRGAQGDIFGFAPLLPVKPPSRPFALRVGGTPLYPAPRLGRAHGLRNLYLKDDTCNPSASTKDRATAVALLRASDVGANTVAAASTGNAGSSLACLAAAIGMRAVIFVPASAPAAKLTQSLSFGAHVLAVRGSYDDAFDLCLAACHEFGWFNRSTGYNPFTREGKKTAAYEIWQALGGRVPDRVVVSTGDGNCLSGMYKGWCDLRAIGLIDRLPRIDCAQSQESAAICNTILRLREDKYPTVHWLAVTIDAVESCTVADSISVDRPRDALAAVKAVLHSGGDAVTVADADILAAIPEIARATGVFAEPAAAASFAAAKRMAADGAVDADELVVCLVSGSGLKDVANARAVCGEPLTIDASMDAVREALAGPDTGGD